MSTPFVPPLEAGIEFSITELCSRVQAHLVPGICLSDSPLQADGETTKAPIEQPFLRTTGLEQHTTKRPPGCEGPQHQQGDGKSKA